MTEPGILVTGGAGYVGSHVVMRLAEQHDNIVVLDDLSTGKRESVISGKLVEGDIADKKLVDELIRTHGVNTVMHFAAKTVVPESVSDPLFYYHANTAKSRDLLAACVKNGVKNFIFSSTAAVYGTPENGIASESSPVNPVNPYGSSKLMTEQMLRDISVAHGLNYVTLRYFNVAGADPEGRIGQSKDGCTLLSKVACEVAVGKRKCLSVFGTDYDTSDGTGVRDYIHVDDIASAHISAIHYLKNGGRSATLNCGYGHGYTVREVIEAVERANGRKLKVRLSGRRPGDPSVLVADASLIRATLGWTPRYDDLDYIVYTDLQWEYQLLERAHRPGPTLRAPYDSRPAHAVE